MGDSMFCRDTTGTITLFSAPKPAIQKLLPTDDFCPAGWFGNGYIAAMAMNHQDLHNNIPPHKIVSVMIPVWRKRVFYFPPIHYLSPQRLSGMRFFLYFVAVSDERVVELYETMFGIPIIPAYIEISERTTITQERRRDYIVAANNTQTMSLALCGTDLRELSVSERSEQCRFSLYSQQNKGTANIISTHLNGRCFGSKKVATKLVFSGASSIEPIAKLREIPLKPSRLCLLINNAYCSHNQN